MSLVSLVAQVLNQHGPMTLDDVLRHAQGHTRVQVQKALENARALGRVKQVQRGTGGPGRDKRPPGIWAAGKSGPVTYVRREPVLPPASVWDLAKEPTPGRLPFPFEGGRAFPLLSSGDEE